MPASTTTQPTSTSAPATATFPPVDEDNVEFEAPPSAELEQRLQLAQERANKGHKGRFSIDLSLELERQLANMESPPITPAQNAFNHSTEDDNTKGGSNDGFAPDPEILAHIITQLRQSLADMTKEKDELIKMLAKANTEEASAKDALQLMTEKVTEAEDELVNARRKIKEDEDQIVLLRAKVEESRRGLMRLQTENRRQSMTPIDVSRASSLGLAAFASPPSSKRASFTPLTGSGRGHRRISSVSDGTFGSFPTPDLTPSPNTQSFGVASPEPSSNRRYSGLFGRQSPPDTEAPLPAVEPARGPSPSPLGVSAELDEVKKELKLVKDELETVKHELQETSEAKEASDTCVKVLREFIAENNVGATPVGGGTTVVKLPPMPAMTTGEEAESKKPTPGGWGFKLWGGADPTPRSTSLDGSAIQSPAMVHSATLPASPAPLSKKLGGFFSSRSSISSATPSQQQPNLPQLQTNAAASPSIRDSMYSFSDASSVAEPVSPGSDIHGLGNFGSGGEPQEAIMVRDVTNLAHIHTHTIEVGKDVDAAVPVSTSGADLDGLR